jgi:hypothetical protein
VWTTADAAAAVKNNTWPVAGVPNPISRSVRLRSSASAYLNRTLTTPTNNKLFTWSGWVKRSNIGVWNDLFGAGAGTNGFGFNTVWNDNGLAFFTNNVTGDYFYLVTTQVFRDPSAWYHIVLSVDTTQATASNRAKIYVNGNQITAFNSAVYQSQNSSLTYNSATTHYLGCLGGPTRFLDGYMTEINFIDGQALTPSSFGTTDSTTGAWVPMPYTGTYGTNGFYLNFKDNTSTTTIGYDYSGNSNNWTANNISLTAGTTYDSMVDVPTLWMPYNTAGDVGATVRGNYCVLNRLVTTLGGSSPPTISDGNLNISFGNAGYSVGGNMFVSSGQIYFEVSGTNAGGITNTISFNGFISDSGSYWGYQVYNGSISSNLGSSAYSGTGYGSGAWPVIGIAVDLSTGKIWWRNDSGWFGSGNPATGANPAFTNVSGNITPYWNGGGGGYSGSHYFNFGQRPFTYTPPSGFKTLNTFNLPAPTINNGASYMAATIYTGDGTANRVITGLSFTPDFIWIKNRSSTWDNILGNYLVKSGTGTPITLVSNSTAAEVDGGYIGTQTTNSLKLATSASENRTNGNTLTYVAWQWKAGGTAVTNTDGTITTTVSANPSSGFSVMTYTGTGIDNKTIGHGLNAVPKFLIWKPRASVTDWMVWHTGLSGYNYDVRLNTTAAQSTGANPLNNTAPTSTVITLRNQGDVNGSGTTIVCYAFAAVAGYSAFGSYTGNGSADGVFVYLGFRPRFVLFRSTSARNWVIRDTSRNTYNAVTNDLYPDSASSEYASGDAIDFLSNGFKLRATGATFNGSGETYIYAAFAENPFKYSNAR